MKAVKVVKTPDVSSEAAEIGRGAGGGTKRASLKYQAGPTKRVFGSGP